MPILSRFLVLLPFLLLQTTSVPFPFHPSPSPAPSPSPSPWPEDLTHSDNTIARQAIASTLLTLLSGPQHAASVTNASLAHSLLSCIHPLLPHPSLSLNLNEEEPSRISLLLELNGDDTTHRLIHSPPFEVAQLARQTVEHGGDPAVVLAALGSTTFPIPDVEGAYEERCELGKYIKGHHFEKQELNQYIAFLFETIADLAPSMGFNVSLSRFDLFVGHMFLAKGIGRLGILFTAREYPAYSEEVFPINLGYCQRGSNVAYDQSINLRNILWLAPMPDCSNGKCSDKWLAPGSLSILDASPGSIIFQELVSDDVKVVRTIYEEDFGTPIFDVNYFNILDRIAENRIFIC